MSIERFGNVRGEVYSYQNQCCVVLFYTNSEIAPCNKTHIIDRMY